MTAKTVTGRVLVDTNVLIYSTLEADRRHDRAQEVLAQRHRDGIDLHISTQNLVEMYPNLTGPKTQPTDSPSIARRKINAIAELRGLTVVPVTPTVVMRALELCERYDIRRQRYFDMQLVATMQSESIGTILTENTADFRDIEGIQVIDPFT